MKVLRGPSHVPALDTDGPSSPSSVRAYAHHAYGSDVEEPRGQAAALAAQNAAWQHWYRMHVMQAGMGMAGGPILLPMPPGMVVAAEGSGGGGGGEARALRERLERLEDAVRREREEGAAAAGGGGGAAGPAPVPPPSAASARATSASCRPEPGPQVQVRQAGGAAVGTGSGSAAPSMSIALPEDSPAGAAAAPSPVAITATAAPVASVPPTASPTETSTAAAATGQEPPPPQPQQSSSPTSSSPVPSRGPSYRMFSASVAPEPGPLYQIRQGSTTTVGRASTRSLSSLEPTDSASPPSGTPGAGQPSAPESPCGDAAPQPPPQAQRQADAVAATGAVSSAGTAPASSTPVSLEQHSTSKQQPQAQQAQQAQGPMGLLPSPRSSSGSQIMAASVRPEPGPLFQMREGSATTVGRASSGFLKALGLEQADSGAAAAQAKPEPVGGHAGGVPQPYTTPTVTPPPAPALPPPGLARSSSSRMFTASCAPEPGPLAQIRQGDGSTGTGSNLASRRSSGAISAVEPAEWAASTAATGGSGGGSEKAVASQPQTIQIVLQPHPHPRRQRSPSSRSVSRTVSRHESHDSRGGACPSSSDSVASASSSSDTSSLASPGSLQAWSRRTTADLVGGGAADVGPGAGAATAEALAQLAAGGQRASAGDGGGRAGAPPQCSTDEDETMCGAPALSAFPPAADNAALAWDAAQASGAEARGVHHLHVALPLNPIPSASDTAATLGGATSGGGSRSAWDAGRDHAHEHAAAVALSRQQALLDLGQWQHREDSGSPTGEPQPAVAPAAQGAPPPTPRERGAGGGGARSGNFSGMGVNDVVSADAGEAAQRTAGPVGPGPGAGAGHPPPVGPHAPPPSPAKLSDASLGVSYLPAPSPAPAQQVAAAAAAAFLPDPASAFLLPPPPALSGHYPVILPGVGAGAPFPGQQPQQQQPELQPSSWIPGGAPPAPGAAAVFAAPVAPGAWLLSGAQPGQFAGPTHHQQLTIDGRILFTSQPPQQPPLPPFHPSQPQPQPQPQHQSQAQQSQPAPSGHPPAPFLASANAGGGPGLGLANSLAQDGPAARPPPTAASIPFTLPAAAAAAAADNMADVEALLSELEARSRSAMSSPRRTSHLAAAAAVARARRAVKADTSGGAGAAAATPGSLGLQGLDGIDALLLRASTLSAPGAPIFAPRTGAVGASSDSSDCGKLLLVCGGGGAAGARRLGSDTDGVSSSSRSESDAVVAAAAVARARGTAAEPVSAVLRQLEAASENARAAAAAWSAAVGELEEASGGGAAAAAGPHQDSDGTRRAAAPAAAVGQHRAGGPVGQDAAAAAQQLRSATAAAAAAAAVGGRARGASLQPPACGGASAAADLLATFLPSAEQLVRRHGPAATGLPPPPHPQPHHLPNPSVSDLAPPKRSSEQQQQEQARQLRQRFLGSFDGEADRESLRDDADGDDSDSAITARAALQQALRSHQPPRAALATGLLPAQRQPQPGLSLGPPLEPLAAGGAAVGGRPGGVTGLLLLGGLSSSASEAGLEREGPEEAEGVCPTCGSPTRTQRRPSPPRSAHGSPEARSEQEQRGQRQELVGRGGPDIQGKRHVRWGEEADNAPTVSGGGGSRASGAPAGMTRQPPAEWPDADMTLRRPQSQPQAHQPQPRPCADPLEEVALLARRRGNLQLAATLAGLAAREAPTPRGFGFGSGSGSAGGPPDPQGAERPPPLQGGRSEAFRGDLWASPRYAVRQQQQQHLPQYSSTLGGAVDGRAPPPLPAQSWSQGGLGTGLGWGTAVAGCRGASVHAAQMAMSVPVPVSRTEAPPLRLEMGLDRLGSPHLGQQDGARLSSQLAPAAAAHSSASLLLPSLPSSESERRARGGGGGGGNTSGGGSSIGASDDGSSDSGTSAGGSAVGGVCGTGCSSCGGSSACEAVAVAVAGGFDPDPLHSRLPGVLGECRRLQSCAARREAEGDALVRGVVAELSPRSAVAAALQAVLLSSQRHPQQQQQQQGRGGVRRLASPGGRRV